MTRPGISPPYCCSPGHRHDRSASDGADISPQLLDCGRGAPDQFDECTRRVGPDRMVDVEIAMKGSDADRVGGTRVVDETAGLVEPTALAASSAPIVAYVEGHTAVLGENGDACSPGAGSVAPDGDGVVVRI